MLNASAIPESRTVWQDEGISVSVVVPTRNAEPHLAALLASLRAAAPAPQRVLFIDSGSTDRSQALIREAGHDLEVIDPRDFGHGRTRNFALRLCGESRYVVFLTQDSIPVGRDWLSRILAPFARPDVAISFGRQLPRPDAPLAERFAREFNYPETADVTVEADITQRGIKAVFCSNSFAAYDRAKLESVGGFPENLPLGEDMAAAMRLLRAGFARAYCPSAAAIHSHDYTIAQEFRRYFDIGVLLDIDPELQRARLAASGEGKAALLAETRLAWQAAGARAVLAAVVHAANKFAGFQLGRNFRMLPRWLCRKCSMHAAYWSRP